MPLLPHLGLNGRQDPPTPPVHHPESNVIAGLLAEIGIIRTLITSLKDEVLRPVVSRCGEYLRCALEEDLRYGRMGHRIQSAGLGPSSHPSHEWCGSEAWVMVPDELDYRRQLIRKERLTERAQRLDSITKIIAEFGFSGIRSSQKKACAHLFEIHPNTNCNEVRNDE